MIAIGNIGSKSNSGRAVGRKSLDAEFDGGGEIRKRPLAGLDDM
jgi:hypothetical protein